MMNCAKFYDFHQVIVHDFFIQIEIHFFQYPVGFRRCGVMCMAMVMATGLHRALSLGLALVQRRSAHWARGPWSRIVPFQQARNAKQVPAHGVSVIGADWQPGSAHAALANTSIIIITSIL
jgi:hypothetical protein